MESMCWIKLGSVCGGHMSWNMYVYVWVIELECRCVSVCVWYVGMLYILVHWNVYVCVCTNFPKCK